MQDNVIEIIERMIRNSFELPDEVKGSKEINDLFDLRDYIDMRLDGLKVRVSECSTKALFEARTENLKKDWDDDRVKAAEVLIEGLKWQQDYILREIEKELKARGELK